MGMRRRRETKDGRKWGRFCRRTPPGTHRLRLPLFFQVYERQCGVGKKQNKTGRRPDPILMKYRFTETKKKTETETIASVDVFARISKNVRKIVF